MQVREPVVAGPLTLNIAFEGVKAMSEDHPTKRCSKCKAEKQVDEFSKCRRNKDGLQDWCKKCQSEAGKRYSKTPQGRESSHRRCRKFGSTTKGKASKLKYRLANKEKLYAHEEQWRISPQGKAKRREYRQKHAARYRERRRRYVLQNKEKVLEAFRKWAHSEAGKTYSVKYRKDHREMCNAHRAVSFAILIGILPPVKTQTCDHCGKPAVHYHHNLGYDFEHWLDVLPLCIKCHGLTRRKEG